MKIEKENMNYNRKFVHKSMTSQQKTDKPIPKQLTKRKNQNAKLSVKERSQRIYNIKGNQFI